MKGSSVFIVTLLWLLSPVHAQDWLPVGPGVDRAVSNLYTDPDGAGLYIGGFFKYSDTLKVGGITLWDGQQYHTLDSGQTTFGSGASAGRAMFKYQGDLYAQIERLAGGVPVNTIARWDGQDWHQMGSGLTVYPDSVDGQIRDMIEYDGKMLVTGGFFYAGGIPVSNMALWDGTDWSAFDDTQWELGVIGPATIYKDDLYIGGNFKNEDKDIWRLARWDGSEWHKVGEGIRGGVNSVGALTVYKGELYVGGDFTKEDDPRNPGSNIAKWDGEKWSDVGGGTYADNGSFGGFINDMMVYNDELYAIGAFVSAGGVPAQSLAKWDGTEWCGFEAGDLDQGAPVSMAIFRDTLYVGGNFKMAGPDSIRYISKLDGPPIVDSCGFLDVGIPVHGMRTDLEIFPNPTTDKVTVQIESLKPIAYTIYSLPLGTSLRNGTVIPNGQVDLSEFSPGSYVIEFQVEHELIYRKISKL